jgi:hypothetical protein
MLKQKALLLLGSLIAVCGLSAVLVYSDRASISNRSQRTTPLTDIEPEHVERIEVRRARGQSIVMKRTKGGRQAHWRLEQPFAIDANLTRVHHLLGFARVASHQRIELAARSGEPGGPRSPLAPFGLEEPWAVLRLDEHQIDFGDKLPTADARYVRVGSAVHVISDAVTHQLQFGPTGFIGLHLLPADIEIGAIALDDARVVRTTEGWQVRRRDRPVSESNVPTDRLVEWLDQWRLAQAVAVRTLTVTANALDSKVTIEPATNRAPITFNVVRDPRTIRFIRAELGIAYELPTERAQALLTLPGGGAVSKLRESDEKR